MSDKMIKVTLTKSLIGQKHDQVKTAMALGLRKLNFSKLVKDNAQINGMLFKIKHHVILEEV